MKILQLRFKNLNSLAGEWSIDFTAPEYVSDGIFAISGPTGAGKTTILDAICLALYGRTPRLDNVSAGDNEIMSRQTGESFAEVVFEISEGRFKAFWSQTRARRKAEGALQQPKREISNAESGLILASQIKSTEELIIQKTGMDFGRFTKSMMLAQGSFAAFLEAKGSDRAPILEQITGTEIYSRISKHVFACQKEEKIKLDQLVERNQDIVLLSQQEESQLILDSVEKNKVKVELSEKKEQLGTAVNWLKTIEKLKTELIAIADEEAVLQHDNDAFIPNLKILKDAKRAASLEGEYATMAALQIQQKTDIDSLAGLKNQIPGLTVGMQALKSRFETVEKEYNKVLKNNDNLLELLKEVRLLDHEIVQNTASVKQSEDKIRLIREEADAERTKITKVENAIADLQEEMAKVNNYQLENQPDATLVAELTGIQVKLSALLDLQIALDGAQKQLKSDTESLEACKLELHDKTQELETLGRQRQHNQDNTKKSEDELKRLLDGRTIPELQAKKDQLILQLANLREISSLDSKRAQLRDNQPCPLCGSLTHPFVKEKIPATSEAENQLSDCIKLLQQVDAAGKKIEEARTAEKISGDAFIQAEKVRDSLLQSKTHLEEILNKQARELGKQTSLLEKQMENLKESLKSYGIKTIPPNQQGTDELIKALIARKEEWQKQEGRKAEIANDILKKQAEGKASEGLIKKQEADLVQKNSELDGMKRKLDEQKGTRIKLFGEENADRAEEKSKKTMKSAEEVKVQSQDAFKKSEQNIKEINNKIDEIQNKIKNKQPEIDKLEEKFAGRLKEYGFADTEQFLTCRLSPEKRDALEAKAKELETKKIALETRKTDGEKRLKAETGKALSGETMEKLSEQLTETSGSLEKILKEVGAISEKLKNNDDKKAAGQQLAEKIENQKMVFERLAMLNDLIGSHDGQKYRNFAQGLTFEIMVSFANRQLVKLSDRYLLIRDSKDSLELKVIDNYQAGEIRSVKNLSGGESFIVSLSLALGLSHMSSRNVNVDSLFLDEGFGTLDEETLETALGALASMRQEGKLIGVISHVEALKERINAKIAVQPVREGRSVLSGPGVNIPVLQ